MFYFHVGRDGVDCPGAILGSKESRATERCQGHACKAYDPFYIQAVFSMCGFWKMYLLVCVRKTETVNSLSWQGNRYTLQSHIEMTLIKQIV